jgi:Fe-S cluster assembly protein SufD
MNALTTEPTSVSKHSGRSAKRNAHSFQEQFALLEQSGAAQNPPWLYPIRQAGLARFAQLGFPTLKDEDWRFTNLEPLARLPFKPVGETALPQAVSLDSFPFSNLAAYRLVFVDGHFAPELSTTGPAPNGCTVSSLADALQTKGTLVESHLAQYAGQDDNPFAALNNALFHEGAFVHVPADQEMPGPVHLLHITTAPDKGSTFHPRHLILAEAGSRLTLLESHVSEVETAYFKNIVTELVAGENAVVEHCKFQDESTNAYHLAALHARLNRASQFWSHSIATGARLSRNNIRTHLGGEGLECVLNGLYLTGDDQLADHHMIVEHASPNCASHEYFNGILDDRSRGVFHGRILVRREAQKTDAKQTNKNLLLSDAATANTKPQLEIYADDVKCTHGATVGQLSEDAIFYLQSRGIGPETARRMLIHSFAGEIIERIQCTPVRDELNQLIWNRLEEHEAVAMDQKESAHV